MTIDPHQGQIERPFEGADEKKARQCNQIRRDREIAEAIHAPASAPWDSARSLCASWQSWTTWVSKWSVSGLRLVCGRDPR
jgi:hypothetical protein